MDIRSKSFQDCREAEIPGYNDCPSFLFQVNKAAAKTGKRNTIVTEVRDVSGNTKASLVPPPPVTSRSAKKKTSDESISECEAELVLSKNEVLIEVDKLCALKSKLPSKEFDFYRKKVDANLSKSLDMDSTKRTMSLIFNNSTDKAKKQLLLREWLTSDTSISNWCPAFIKIFENAIHSDI